MCVLCVACCACRGQEGGGHSAAVNGVALSPDLASVASCADERKVLLWNTKVCCDVLCCVALGAPFPWVLVCFFVCGAAAVRCPPGSPVCVHMCACAYVYVCVCMRVRLFVQTGVVTQKLKADKHGTSRVAFSADGTLLVTAGWVLDPLYMSAKRGVYCWDMGLFGGGVGCVWGGGMGGADRVAVLYRRDVCL